MGGLFGDPWKTGTATSTLLKTGQEVTPDQAWALLGSSGGGSAGPGQLLFSIEDLPTAHSDELLIRWRFTEAINLEGNGPGSADAGIAASSPSSLVVKKNGAANGTIDFTGTSGVINLTNSAYSAGDLFELYAPSSIDPTLDQVSITFETD